MLQKAFLYENRLVELQALGAVASCLVAGVFIGQPRPRFYRIWAMFVCWIIPSSMNPEAYPWLTYTSPNSEIHPCVFMCILYNGLLFSNLGRYCGWPGIEGLLTRTSPSATDRSLGPDGWNCGEFRLDVFLILEEPKPLWSWQGNMKM